MSTVFDAAPHVKRPGLFTGRKLTRRGYVLVYRPDHPYAAKCGYIFEHRLVMEAKLGRYLLPGEVVHHINGVRNDNGAENLELMDHAAHTIHHHTGLKRSTETRAKISEKAKRRFADKRNHHEYRAIEPEDFKAAILALRSPAAICRLYNFTNRTFYNKLAELNLREWYFDAQSDYLDRSLNGRPDPSLHPHG